VLKLEAAAASPVSLGYVLNPRAEGAHEIMANEHKFSLACVTPPRSTDAASPAEAPAVDLAESGVANQQQQVLGERKCCTA
jgi:hypothetical protein